MPYYQKNTFTLPNPWLRQWARTTTTQPLSMGNRQVLMLFTAPSVWETLLDCQLACLLNCSWCVGTLRVDSQASRRTKCCESVITLLNVITLHSVGVGRTLWVHNPSEIGGWTYVQFTAFREWRRLWVDFESQWKQSFTPNFELLVETFCVDMFSCEDSKIMSVCPYPEKRNHPSFVSVDVQCLAIISPLPLLFLHIFRY